jgi:hydrogenase maturation protease
VDYQENDEVPHRHDMPYPRVRLATQKRVDPPECPWLHQISLIDVLQMTELTGKKPKTIIIAVQPKDVSSWSLELSAEVRATIPKVKELIFEELKQAAAL